MEKEDCEEENILKHDELVLSHDQKCKNADQDEIITYKHPVKPKVLKAGERNDSSREKARLWRKKRMLNKPTKSKEAGKVHRDVPNPRNVPKFRKEPLPMCKRALPESFWKEPTTIQTSSLSSNVYSRFPPLFSSDNNNSDVDITEIRPVTPPGECSPQKSKKPTKYLTSPPDTELLFSLFDRFDSTIDKRLIVRRGRPKKLPTESREHLHPPKKEDDPCMLDDLSEKLFPQLSLHGSSLTGIQKHAIIKLPRGGQTVELPAVQLEKHYPVMLDHLAMHL